MSAPTLVVGTAGHVDHGKTTLVRALTGVDLDRLPEEKERGITISLGFTPLALPSGRVAGLVDVPGHERLVRTMVAGATGMDAVLLCVSAAEGVMPQTREHLDILELLGVRTGILVLTMADLVDDELLELAADELRDQVKGTLLEGAPVIATSATTGRGLDELRAAIDALAPPARSLDAPFRLPADRSFARKGFGTVVTGTAWSGRLADGSEVEIIGDDPAALRRTRVRGIQVHGKAENEARAGARTALNLAGIDVADVPRGSWIVAPGSVPATLVFDARYRHLPGAVDLDGEPNLLVLHGTREVPARIVPLDADGLHPGESTLVQIRAAVPIPALPGDRFVVRLHSPSTTVGGGVVLDPYAPVTRRSRAVAQLDVLRRLEAGDVTAWLDRAGPAGLLDADAVRRMGPPSPDHPWGERWGDRWFSTAVAARHRATLHETLAAAHAAAPLTSAVNRKALRAGSLRSLGDREYLALIEGEVAAGRIVADARGVRLPEWQVTLDASQESWRAKATTAAEAAGYDGVPSLREVADHPDYSALEHRLEETGELERIGDRHYSPVVLARLVDAVRTALGGPEDTGAALDPAAFKELTGQSRRTAIPLLEWLDARGYTRRVGDQRVRGPRL